MTQQQSAVTDEIRRAIGVDSEAVENEVEKGAIRRFAEALDDPNPLWLDEVKARESRWGGITAPPTFFRSLRGASREQFKVPFTRVLDGGSDWEYFHPVRPGDRIKVITRLVEAYERQGRLGPMLFLVRETRYVNQFGQVVATQRATGISY